ncbi:UNVERIFIED_CONTAM: hypothetical protein K2H54_054965 [Gekko kuhli]
MNSSFESLYSAYSMHSESKPLLQNGQLGRSPPQPASGTNPLRPLSPQQKVHRSQPMRIMAVSQGSYLKFSIPPTDASKKKSSSSELPLCLPSQTHFLSSAALRAHLCWLLDLYLRVNLPINSKWYSLQTDFKAFKKTCKLGISEINST